MLKDLRKAYHFKYTKIDPRKFYTQGKEMNWTFPKN